MRQVKKKLTTQPSKEVLQIHRIYKTTKTLIKIIATVLAFAFTWLEFHDLPLTPLFTDAFSGIVFKITLASFFLSWVIGVSKDLEDQEYVLLIAPNKGKLAKSSITVIVILGVLFGCLCIVDSFRAFAIILTVFSIFNVFSWFYYKGFVKKALDDSEDKYKMHNDSYGTFKIKTIRNFLWGDWQKERFYIGFTILIFINILVFSNLSQIIATKLKIPSSQFVVVLSFFLYICVTEIWIWYVRFKRNIVFELLEEIKEENRLNNLM